MQKVHIPSDSELYEFLVWAADNNNHVFNAIVQSDAHCPVSIETFITGSAS